MELHSLKPQIIQGLQSMKTWFHNMVDPTTGRLFYKYSAATRQYLKEPSPVRDLGTVADLGALQGYFNTTEFSQVMQLTLDHYKRALVQERTFEDEGQMTAEGLGHTETEPELADHPLPWSYLDPAKIDEPSSIAHNSMFILALAWHEHYPREEEKERLMMELADGILHQQRVDGTYKVYFAPNDLGDFGFELYSGEAMLAMLTAYERLGDTRYLESVERAMPQYERIYRSGSIGRDELVFFANWQSQAGRLLARHTTDAKAAAHIANYLYHMHDTIMVKLKLYEAIQKFPNKMATVEVACALEGLVDAYSLALQEGAKAADRQQRYASGIKTAVEFLQEVQRKSAESGEEAAVGGFGHGLTRNLQRIDVTGHVSSAYIKLISVLEEREQ